MRRGSASSTQAQEQQQRYLAQGAQHRVTSNNGSPHSPHAAGFQQQSRDNGATAWRHSISEYSDEDDEALLAYPGTPSRSLRNSRPPSANSRHSQPSARRPSNATVYSLYPPADHPPPLHKPLPPVPALPSRTARRVSSTRGSIDATSDGTVSTDPSRYSQSSNATSSEDRVSTDTSPHTASHLFPPSIPEDQIPSSLPAAHGGSAVAVAPWKLLTSNDKSTKSAKDQSVYFFDVTTSSTTLASKHGNNIIKVWSVGSGAIQNIIKISCYTTAQARSREYFVRSHAILSEPSSLIAIAVGFGDSLELWDWSKKKKLQTIDSADRWAAVRSNVYESAWSPLVTYRGSNDTLELWSTTPHSKKPFKKSRTINIRNAGLPILPKYPELAFSATSPILVAASGPRPPRLGHPPPERETLLVAWDIQDIDANSTGAVSDAPYKFVTPWQHTELDTALPSGLATYGSVAVSIWIPASYRAVPVPAARGGQGFNLAPITVPYRYVLVWDFSASSTRTFRIPNSLSCVSPDCRYIAYCDQAGTGIGARGNLVILDALSGKRLWCWPDPDASASDSGPRMGMEQLDELNKISEISFSADGGFLFLGTNDGEIGVYELKETQNMLTVNATGAGGPLAHDVGRAR